MPREVRRRKRRRWDCAPWRRLVSTEVRKKKKPHEGGKGVPANPEIANLWCAQMVESKGRTGEANLLFSMTCKDSVAVCRQILAAFNRKTVSARREARLYSAEGPG